MCLESARDVVFMPTPPRRVLLELGLPRAACPEPRCDPAEAPRVYFAAQSKPAANLFKRPPHQIENARMRDLVRGGERRRSSVAPCNAVDATNAAKNASPAPFEFAATPGGPGSDATAFRSFAGHLSDDDDTRLGSDRHRRRRAI